MTEEEYEADFLRQMIAFQPWLAQGNEQERQEQIAIQAVLKRHCGGRFGENVYIASNARVFTQSLDLGDRTIVAGGAILRGVIETGADCSINSYAHLAGKITIGTGVRIAGHAAIYGFNHGTARTDIMIKDQPITMSGISIGDGTWIGTHAVILDGVEVGAHCVIAAGAVVTKSCPGYSIVVGNPGRAISRKSDTASTLPGSAPDFSTPASLNMIGRGKKTFQSEKI